MAFPTSSLTNNQVHKEGNRAFVYDSALGVWDQVRETDRTENKILQGEIGAGVTFPAGHVVKVYSRTYTSTHALGTSGTFVTVGNTDANRLEIDMDVPASSSSKYFIQVNLSVSDHVSGNIDFRLMDITDTIIPVRATGASNRANYFLGLGHQSTNNGSYHHIRSVGNSYLWSPNVSTAQRVKLQGSCISGGTVFYINRSTTDTDASWSSRSTSTMTVMEIAG